MRLKAENQISLITSWEFCFKNVNGNLRDEVSKSYEMYFDIKW